ncbi:hypothetical protein ACHAQF_001861 [Verticillium nonalfalfae]
MPIESRWTTPTPEVALHKWVFGSSFGELIDQKIFFDADSPATRFLTLSDFRLLSKRVALGLQRAGLSQGDRVLICSSNSLFFPPLFMGVLMAGGIFTGASIALRAGELAYQLRDSGASFVFAESAALATTREACLQAGIPSSRLFSIDGSDPNLRETTRPMPSWTNMLASAAEAARFDWVEPQDPRATTCCLNYSSGTTGNPKGVEITHFAYVANGEGTTFLRRQINDGKAGETPDASICFMPLYHAAGQTSFIVNNPRMLIPTYIMPAYNFEKLLSHIQTFKITSIMTAPPILLSLAKSPLAAKFDLSSIRDVVSGTAPLAPEISAEVEKRIWPDGQNFVSQAWGMTEVTCTGSMKGPDDQQRTLSVGEIVPNAQFRLVQEDGTEVTEANKSGELWFSGPTLMKGYWKNPTATANTLHEEHGITWLKTGDVVYVDKYAAGAKIHIVDRIKDLIKVRGFQVSPTEIEGVLLDHKGVTDAAVVGVVVRGEEVPRAYVVRAPEVTEVDLFDWVNKRVAKYKQLRGGLAFVDSIPRLPTGKILRRALRQRAQQEVDGVKARLV